MLLGQASIVGFYVCVKSQSHIHFVNDLSWACYAIGENIFLCQ